MQTLRTVLDSNSWLIPSSETPKWEPANAPFFAYLDYKVRSDLREFRNTGTCYNSLLMVALPKKKKPTYKETRTRTVFITWEESLSKRDSKRRVLLQHHLKNYRKCLSHVTFTLQVSALSCSGWIVSSDRPKWALTSSGGVNASHWVREIYLGRDLNNKTWLVK